MGRFFVLPEQIENDRIMISGSDVKHMKNVLRYSAGTKINVCSEGVVYESIIEEITSENVIAVIEKRTQINTELKVPVVLYQGLPKGDKMDLIIQKNVELGITKIVPVMMERTIVKLEGKDIAKKVERWNRIAMEAAKQCGRLIIPEVANPVQFRELSKVSCGILKLMPYENEEELTIKSVLRGISEDMLSIDVLIGPEGGISQGEAQSACDMGFVSVSLGERILRTETAGFYVTGCIAYEFG